MAASGKLTIYIHVIGKIPGIQIALKTICNVFEIYSTISINL